MLADSESDPTLLCRIVTVWSGAILKTVQRLDDLA
jgi:hypothetical protein